MRLDVNQVNNSAVARLRVNRVVAMNLQRIYECNNANGRFRNEHPAERAARVAEAQNTLFHELAFIAACMRVHGQARDGEQIFDLAAEVLRQDLSTVDGFEQVERKHSEFQGLIPVAA
jgi:hypothetical protein